MDSRSIRLLGEFSRLYGETFCRGQVFSGRHGQLSTDQLPTKLSVEKVEERFTLSQGVRA